MPIYTLNDADLEALAALASSGLIARTGAGTVAARTLTQPAAGITVSNGDGVAGNPTLALADDLAAVEALATVGGVERTGASTWAIYTLTAAGKALLDDVDAAAQRATLALVPGTNVQAWDADLDAIAALATTGYIKRTGAGTAAIVVVTANGESLITAADYAAMRVLLGLVIGTNVQAQNAILEALAGLGTLTAGDLIKATGASALNRLASAAGVLQATGAGVAPAYTESPALQGLTLNASDVPSQINARSNHGAVYFDANVSNTRIYHTIQNVGTSSFSLLSRVVVLASNPSVIRGILGLSDTTTTALRPYAASLRVSTTGTLLYSQYGATTADHRTLTLDTNLVTGWANQVIDIAVVRNTPSGTATIYINGVAKAATESTGGTPPAWADSITSTYAVIGIHDAANIYAERILKAQVWNRVLSVAEIGLWRTRGVSWIDQWGSLTDLVGYAIPTLNGDFETTGSNGGTRTGLATVERSRSSNVATLKITAHGLTSTNVITTTLIGGTGYNLAGVVATVVDVDHFTYPCTGADEGVTEDTAGRMRTDVFANWVEDYSGSSTINAELVSPYAGAKSLRLDVDGSGSLCGVYQTPPLTLGKRYRLTFWAKVSDATGSPRLYTSSFVGTPFVATPTTSWAQYSVEGVASQTFMSLYRYNEAAVYNKSFYIDNLVVQGIGCLLDSDLETYQEAQGTYVHDRSTNKFAGVATATGLNQVKVYNRIRNLSVYASGTAYTLTATPALLDFGTTDPSLVITAPGTWQVRARVRLDRTGCTFSAGRTVTLKLRRTNNTPADLTNGSAQLLTGTVTTLTDTFMVVDLPSVFYSTSNSDDIIQIFGDVSVVPDAGTLVAAAAEITAIRLY